MYHIYIDSIQVDLDDGNEGINIGVHQKVILKVKVHDIHKNILKKDNNGSLIIYDNTELVHISDSSIQLILPQKYAK